MIFSNGYVKIRDGKGERFYTVAYVWNGHYRYSIRRFETAMEAELYEARLVFRVRRLEARSRELRQATFLAVEA